MESNDHFEGPNMFKLYSKLKCTKSRIRNETIFIFQIWKNLYISYFEAKYTFLAEPIRISSCHPHARPYELKTRKGIN